MVMFSVKMDLARKWSTGIDQLKHTVRGSEINFPDNHWDWSVHFYDEISVDSWVQVKLKQGKKKVTEEDEDDADDKDRAAGSAKIGIPLLDKLIDLGIQEILV